MNKSRSRKVHNSASVISNASLPRAFSLFSLGRASIEKFLSETDKKRDFPDMSLKKKTFGRTHPYKIHF